MTSETITLILPLPNRVLSPNCPAGTRRGRMMKAAATKKYRAVAKDIAEQVQLETGPWAKAQARLIFHWKDRRRRDIRNAESMMKPAYDGIVDAGVLVDDSYDHLTHLPTQFECDPECPRVEVVIERLDGEDQ